MMKFNLLRLFMRLVFPKDVVVRNATIRNGILTLPPYARGLIADSAFINTSNVANITALLERTLSE